VFTCITKKMFTSN